MYLKIKKRVKVSDLPGNNNDIFFHFSTFYLIYFIRVLENKQNTFEWFVYAYLIAFHSTSNRSLVGMCIIQVSWPIKLVNNSMNRS